MTEIVADLSQTSLATAVKANLYAFFQALCYSGAATVHDSLHGFNWRTDIAHPWFNGMLSTLPPTADASQIINETVNYFQAHDVPHLSWWLAPHLEPTDWSQYLLAYGFRYNNSTPGMAVDLATLPQPTQHPLTIQRVEGQHMLAEWTDTLKRGFGMPAEMASGMISIFESLGTDLPFRSYLGYLNDRPVACSTLYLGAGVAGIYNIATVPEARGQGVGSAMTLAPLYEAREMGYRAGILQSSEMGYGVYQLLGFQKLCQVDYFYWQVPDS
ncbi:MAG: GNAT family N-acetyltransferase [Anaerolineaceae bacterium]|nr:GNAT family N-acetyltransferase [Anaerolineaceae bacterium]